MATFRPGTADQTAFLEALIERGLLIPSGVPGVYGRGAAFEQVRVGVDGRSIAPRRPMPPRCCGSRRCCRATSSRPGLPQELPAPRRHDLRVRRDEAEANEQFELGVAPRGLERVPAHERPGAAAGRVLPGLPGDRRARAAGRGGVTVDAGGAYVFRQRAVGRPARLQMFHKREIVRIGEPDDVVGVARLLA